MLEVLEKVHHKINEEYHVKMKHLLLFHHFINRDFTKSNALLDFTKIVERLNKHGFLDLMEPSVKPAGLTINYIFTPMATRVLDLLNMYKSQPA